VFRRRSIEKSEISFRRDRKQQRSAVRNELTVFPHSSKEGDGFAYVLVYSHGRFPLTARADWLIGVFGEIPMARS
jgi:hypothetical protein